MPERDDIPIELTNWLRVACMGLMDSVARQVREEAIARYQSVYGEARVKGFSEPLARKMAIAEMCNPWIMREKYIKVPSKWEEDIFEPVKKWLRGHNRPEPKNLEEWLAIATEDLSASSKKLVAAEIRAHYQDAVTAQCEDGLDENQAQTEALVALGPVRIAACHLAKSYLSESDLKCIERVRRDYRPLRTGIIKTALGLSGVYILMISSMWPDLEWHIIMKFLAISLMGFFLGNGVRHIICFYTLDNKDDGLNRIKRALNIIFISFFIPAIMFMLLSIKFGSPQEKRHPLLNLLAFVAFTIVLFIAHHQNVKNAIRTAKLLKDHSEDKNQSDCCLEGPNQNA